MKERTKLLDAEEVARWLKTHPDHILKLAREGKIKSVRPTPRMIRFIESDVEDFITNGKDKS